MNCTTGNTISYAFNIISNTKGPMSEDERLDFLQSILMLLF